MPLSFITILGGMTTVIGSATNILVADVAQRTAKFTIEFFSFTPIGLILAGNWFNLYSSGHAIYPQTENDNG